MTRTTNLSTRVLAAFVALVVILSIVTGVGVAQSNASDGDGDEDAEPNDSMANATRITYGQEINASLSSPNDTDYYAVDAVAGEAIVAHFAQERRLDGRAMRVDLLTPTGEVVTELDNDLMGGPENELRYDDTGYTGNVMESNGTHYVRVTSQTSVDDPATDANPYNLTVNRTAVDEYEPNENGSTATPVTAGETLTATFAGYDSDVYALNVTAGESYTVSIAHPNDLGSDFATKVLYVYANRSQVADDPAWQYAEDGKSPYYRGPNGSTVATSGTIRYGPVSVEFTAETNGTYYLQLVQDRENYNLLAQDAYRLAVNTDLNGDAANATNLSSGELVLGTLSPGEEDWYAVTGRTGDRLEANVGSQTDTRLPDTVRVDLVTANGDVLQESPGTDTDPGTAAKILESNGTYYVRVRNTQTNASERHDYSLGVGVEEIDQYDPNENGSTATPLAVNETITARITDHDSDVYAVNLTAGQTYTVTLNETNYAAPDRRLLVYDDAADATHDPGASNATPVAGTSNTGTWSNVMFTAENNGTYYVQVVREVDTRLLHMDYELTVRSPGARDDAGDGARADREPNDSPANATHVDYGQEINATLSSPDDVDYYAVNATAGDGLVSRLLLENMFEGSAIAVDIVDADGHVSTESGADVTVGPPTVAGEARSHRPRHGAAAGDVMESDGTYYVRVREATEYARTNEFDTYRYSLTTTTQNLDGYDPNENATTATPIAPDEPLSAVVAGYDTDTYALNVTAGRRYTVSVNASRGITEKLLLVAENASVAIDDPDPYTRQDGAPGVVAKRQIDDSPTNVTFVAQTDGTYYLQVGQSALNTQLASPENYMIGVEETDRATDADADGDGLTDDCELRNGMDPIDPDTDDDGTLDGDEV